MRCWLWYFGASTSCLTLYQYLVRASATSKRLSSESERLTNDLKHIERDEKVLNEEESELQGQIGEETKEYDDKSAEAR